MTWWYQFTTAAVSNWYHEHMDVNIKNLEPEVLARLAEQAAAEGVSQQEWLRQVLRRTAQRLSSAELVAQRESVTPMTEAEFARLQQKVRGRRHAATERLHAPGRRR